MFASIVLTAHLILPMALTPPPTRDCQLEDLTITAIDRKALERFRDATHDYSAIHRRLERALMLDHVPWSDDEDMGAEMLADAIRSARPRAREGSIFDSETAALVRFRLARAAWLLRYDAAGAPAASAAETAEVPVVHDWWRSPGGAEPWPSLVSDLPALPDELAYVVQGRHLVLVDAHAGLIVDVLRDALPER